MIPVKTSEEIGPMRDACRVAAQVLAEIVRQAAPGVTTWDLDQLGRRLMEEAGATSACYNYRLGSRRFPAYTCLSVNEEVVHGIGTMKRRLRPGDVLTVDVCVNYGGFIGDNARTLVIGPATTATQQLVEVTEAALTLGIAQARPGRRVGAISSAIQKHVEQHGFSVVREFVGHGVGRSMHEQPQIPNFGRPSDGPLLRPGMTLAIEPMVAAGRPEVEILADGWTAVTRDGRPSAHFEHTVLVTEDEPEILTLAGEVIGASR